MSLKPNVFTTENIIALLQAAPDGGTLDDVIARARITVSPASLAKWIKDGNRDNRSGKDTSYGLFVQQWNTLYPGPPPRYETARMIQMKEALNRLGIQCDKKPVSATQASAPAKSPRICECGNSKAPRALACSSCLSIDSVRAA